MFKSPLLQSYFTTNIITDDRIKSLERKSEKELIELWISHIAVSCLLDFLKQNAAYSLKVINNKDYA